MENLAALRGAVGSVSAAGEAQGQRLSDLRTEMVAVKTRVATAARELSDPHEMHHDTMRRGTDRLSTMIQQLRRSVEDHQEALQVSQLQLEEERTRTIMLDEERSRLSHDNDAVRERLAETKRSSSTRIEASRREAQAVMTLRDDLERQLQRTMAQLEEANAQTRSLQESTQDLQRRLRDEQGAHGQDMSELESHTQRLEAESKATAADRNALRVQVESLQHELAGSSAEASELQRKLTAIEEEQQQMRTRASSESAQYKNQAASMNNSMRKLHEQLEQTKKLLDTVQQQRQMLSGANAQLRQELDSIYKARAGT